MTEGSSEQQFERLVRRIYSQSSLLRRRTLPGGFSAQVSALEVELADGQRTTIVVRQHGARDLEQNPQVAAHEFTLLRRLYVLGLPVPPPIACDATGEIFPAPYVVLKYIEGSTDPFHAKSPAGISQLAATLAAIHRVDCAIQELAFLPHVAGRVAELLSQRPAAGAAAAEERIRKRLESVWPLPACNEAVLLHGDYWPGNTVWRDDQLVAVIDWEDAAIGDPLSDLANCRLELLWAFGGGVMDRFTEQYLTLMPTVDCTNLPYWDLAADLRLAPRIAEWANDKMTEASMRARNQWFVNRAFEQLTGR